MAKKGGLGRGLDALFVENDTSSENGAVTLKLTEIEPNKNQPRKQFDENALAELAQSISEHGIIQPLLVRPQTNGRYLLVAGERRWRASRMAGLSEVPVIIKEMDDAQVAEIALIENLQREDLNPIEEAQGYKELMDKFSLTQDEVAKKVGKSRPAVANALRLLNLPDEVLPLVVKGKLSAGHARAMLSLPEEVDLSVLAEEIVKKGISVREVEKLSKEKKQPSEKKSERKTTRDTYFDEMELALTEALGKKIQVTYSGNKGILQIEFYNKEELSALADKLTK